MTNWNEIKIRCSSLGSLMTEPQAKADKEAGNLSATAKSHLIKVYMAEKYKRYYDIDTKYTKKGNGVEEDSITTLTLFTGKMLYKNEERLTNNYFTGLPDIYIGESITKAKFIFDIKSSWNMETFLSNLKDDLNKDYYGQLQGYFDLTGASEGAIAYILSNTPDSILEGEKYRVLKNLDVVSEESPEAQKALAQLYLNHQFDDLDVSERVLLFPVKRDDEYIEKAKQKVLKAREYLQQIEEKHLNFNKNVQI